MARNRKYQSAAIRFGPVLKAFLLCLLIGGSGVGYVWQKNQIFDLGEQIRLRERKLAGLEYQNDILRKQFAKMQLLGYLEPRIKELNLGLVPLQPQQKWLLRLPAAAGSPATGRDSRDESTAGTALTAR